ncbi:riboflavin synthase [candidate division LCP-89 bacterium B3_LCP]|uniref:Riboflavin synthase n=1 Tax=candidate division LCP-89 bacterium B3_LCP TaxID=2012998 RepID=A0A532V3E9_UNCL8|nr:MAG: riboflavin synthase [candidate division LCP-89 bacterium B3_LCP]
MFTGLIETIGTIQTRRKLSAGMSFEIKCNFNADEYRKGESIAVDGICVTVESFNTSSFTFNASDETLKRGTIGEKKVGDKVHLERALRLGDRLGGHIVQGHVDDVGKVLRILRKGNTAEMVIEMPPGLLPYVVEKGSIALHGVSLTIAEINRQAISVSLIPETLNSTYFGDFKHGDKVNIEVDILAKYTESMLNKKDIKLDENKLRDWGFE